MSAELDRFLASAFACLDPATERVALTNAYSFMKGDEKAFAFPPHRWIAGQCQRPLGLHYNCSSIRLDAVGARGLSVARAHVIIFDDLGDHARSKAPLDRLLALKMPPHAVIATRRDRESRTNNQAVYFIEPHKPEAARILVKAAAEAGWCDPACSGGLRWARPPGSIKVDGDGFAAKLTLDNYSAPRISLEELAALLGIEEIARQLIDEYKVRRVASRKPPSAEIVRAAMAAIINDLDRNEWVRVGLALKASCGDPPALSDGEAFALFDAFSREHPSYDQAATTRFWRTARPDGRSSFGTVVHFARACGWDAVAGVLVRNRDAAPGAEAAEAVLAPDEHTGRSALRAFGGNRALIVPPLLLPWFHPGVELKRVLAVASAEWPEAFAWLGDVGWRLQRKGVVVRIRILDEPQPTKPERERRPGTPPLESAARPETSQR